MGDGRRSEEMEEEEEDFDVRVAWSSRGDGKTAKITGNAMGAGNTRGKGEDGADDFYTAPKLEEHSIAWELNVKGNQKLKKNELQDAVDAYSRAIDAANASDEKNAPVPSGRDKNAKRKLDIRCGIPLSNRSHAYLRLAMAAQQKEHLLAGSHGGRDRDWYVRRSIKDAEQLCALCPHWSKAHYRLTSALMYRGDYANAIRAVSFGIANSKNEFCARRDFAGLYDEVTMTAASKRSMAGFTGRLLEVRSAGDDAWLGLPAPKDPVLDADEDDKPVSMIAAGTGDAVADAALWTAADDAWRKKAEKTSFRSIKDAVASAKDNDRIVLLRGMHNIGGEAVVINKRLLIYGEGRLGETVIDQRANAPTFTVTRPCVIRNLKIELTGFRECLRFQSDAALTMPNAAGCASPSAIVDGCVVSSSGSDGIHIGNSDPLIRNCTVTGRHCAILAAAQAPTIPRTGFLHYCRIGTAKDGGGDGGGGGGGGSEQQCVRAMRGANLAIECCELSGAKMEGIACMDSARVSIVDSSISGNGGPGIDVTGDGMVTLANSEIADNCGGIWVWERGHVHVHEGTRTASVGYGVLGQSIVKGGSSHALLVCDEGKVDCGHNGMVEGVVDVYDDAEVDFGIANGAIAGKAIQLGAGFEPTSLPPQTGPAFRFMPNEFTRKQ